MNLSCRQGAIYAAAFDDQVTWPGSIPRLSLANQCRGRFSRSASMARRLKAPVAAKGSDESITPVYELNQRGF